MVGLVAMAIMSVPLYFLGRFALPFTKDLPYLSGATEVVVGLMTVIVIGCLTLMGYLLVQLVIIVGIGARGLAVKIRSR